MKPKYENKKIRQGFELVIGCDEAGRGSLAGPIVAAAVALWPQAASFKLQITNYKQIKDSKLLTAEKRAELSTFIKQNSFAWAASEVSHNIIDKINIHNASLLAMQRAVKGVLAQVSFGTDSAVPCSKVGKAERGMFVFVDGKFKVPDINIPQEAIIDGDNKILSIAAASIVAKVHRDKLMKKLHNKYKIYNFAQHKGYGTLHHRQMIVKHNLSPIHRKSFCTKLVFN